MTIQRFFYLIFISLFFVPFAEGQITKDQVKSSKEDHHHHEEDHHHAHQDSSYHCGMCNGHLFDEHEATKINNEELHYHGIGTEDHKTAFHCAGCKGHLGNFNHKHNNYEVLNDKVDQKENGTFYCSVCQMPLFEGQAVDKNAANAHGPSVPNIPAPNVKKGDKQQATKNYNDLYTYFKAPINENRIALEKRNKFYKASKATSTIHCRVCDGQLGGLNNNDSGGFGLRVGINKVKKQKKNKK